MISVSLLRAFIITAALLLVHEACAQTGTISGRVLSSGEEQTPVVGATVRVERTTRGAVADREGFFRIARISPGDYTLDVSSIGFERVDTTVSLGAGDSLFLVIMLEPDDHETQEVVVTGTRTQRTIDDVPVRVEAVPQEEVEEKLLMAPANVSMLLNESTGMRVQTTSPTTSTANLRIQGLPGRYTQILTDGVPNVGGLAAGFGLTELPPLNLRQVEIIKGAASALYGADAISGVVNFITKDPRPELELSALVNVTSQKGLDLAAYAGRSFGDAGFTLMASRNAQPRFDVDGDGFADVPETARYTVYPKLVLEMSDAMLLDVALGFIADDRLGGAMAGERLPGGSEAPYHESVSSKRFSGTAQWSWEPSYREAIALTAAGMTLDRESLYGRQPFDATQRFLYGEVQYSTETDRHSLLFAGVVSVDDFEDRTAGATVERSYRYITPGLLAQEELRFSDVWTGLVSSRVDFHNEFGTFFTPRASVMFRPSQNVTLRLGGGTGFKAPTIFIEEAEERGFQSVRLLEQARAEESRSGTFDVNWRGSIADEVGFSLNAAAYLTLLEHALIADDDSLGAGSLILRNATGATTSRGAEVSTKVNYADLKLSLGYTFLYATQTDAGATGELALNPRHSLGAILMWESEEAGAKAGFEAYWTGTQRLEDHPTREISPSYLIAGLFVEKAFGPIRVFINFENFTDTRQTRFEPIVVGDPAAGRVQPLTIYAPLEGRVVNGGIRFVL